MFLCFFYQSGKHKLCLLNYPLLLSMKFVFFFSFRSKSDSFSLKKTGEEPAMEQGTWCIQKACEVAASYHPPSGRGLSLRFLPDWLWTSLGTHTQIHTRKHTYTQINQLQTEQQEVAECLPLCHWICKHPLQSMAKASYSLGSSQPENLGTLPKHWQPLSLAQLPEPHRKVINSLNKASVND